MFLSAAIDVLEKVLPPAAFILAIVVVLVVPKFRKGITECFRAGQNMGNQVGRRAGEKLAGRKPDDHDNDTTRRGK